jgi:hypothetical protein
MILKIVVYLSSPANAIEKNIDDLFVKGIYKTTVNLNMVRTSYYGSYFSFCYVFLNFIHKRI